LNVQPVIPITLNKDWNLITRTIVPIINQPSPASGIPSAFGLGDINPTVFLSPANSGKLIWGVGPTMTFPTATESLLGDGKWSAGPSVVVLTTPGHWVIGALANNQWSFAGWGNKSVDALLVQPFINYNFPDGWYVTTSPIITANWLAASNERWTLPIGGGVGKIVKLGKLPVNLQLQAFDNVVTPNRSGADWQLRFQVQLLFPKLRRKNIFFIHSADIGTLRNGIQRLKGAAAKETDLCAPLTSSQPKARYPTLSMSLGFQVCLKNGSVGP